MTANADPPRPLEALTVGVQAAWGRKERPGRGPRPELTLDRIVGAGVALADAEGIQAVSMSKVAAALGAGAMSLYRYVSGKDELLILMVDAAYGAPTPRPAEAAGWRAGLTWWARTQLDAMNRHRWASRVPIPGPPLTPHTVRWLEQGLRTLSGLPLSETEKMSVVLLISGYVRNEATLSADLDASFLAGSSPQEAMTRYGRLLTELTDELNFPELTAVISSGFFEAQDDPPDAEFLFGLERILDGIDLLIQQEKNPRAANASAAPGRPDRGSSR
jgi:AcrR family transcriptional regulator